jgi:peptidoglycan/LPS O-acetylase OafA/YrhL/lysophospholipase L1-like esterase
MRAVAVIVVVVFHAGLSWLPGGFLGVDVFFVLSGYLITTLVLAEVDRTDRLDLMAFWARRARRLLPALIVLVAVVSAVSPVVLPAAETALIRDDALSALAYLANWRMILRGTDYFAQNATPSPLQHTWSLAIEEQFYLLWPLVLLLFLRWAPVRRQRLVAVGATAVLGAVASVAAGWLLAGAGRDLDRVYFGSDTRAVSILVGVGLAGVLATGRGSPHAVARQCRRLLGVAAAVATAVLVWLFSHAQGDDSRLYHGPLLLTALAVAAVLAHAVLVPQSLTARVLSLSPLPALGRISYGVYLWHWPLLAWLNNERTGLHGPSLLLLRCLVTVAVAALSYLLIERSIRAGGWQLLRRPGHTLTAAAIVLCTTASALVALTPRLSPQTESTFADPAPTVGGPSVVPPVSLDVAPPVSLDSHLDGHGAAAPEPLSTPVTDHHHRLGSPVTVEVFGDSLARSLVNGLPAHPGLIVHDDTMMGCGLLLDSPFRYFGSIQQQRSQCAGWPQLLQQAATTDGVDVVMILVGRWETMDRVHSGQWTHLGDPSFDDYVHGELDRAVGIAASGGARVVLATEPYNRRGERPDGELWPEDEPDRVQRWNALLREVAAAHPDTVQVIELGARLCPEGHFTKTVDDIAVRSDGVHLTPQGVHWLAPWLLPQLAAAAR